MATKERQTINASDVGSIQPEILKPDTLAKTSPTSLAKDDAPTFLQKTGPARGFEEVDREDLVVPRLALAQSLSPQKKPSNEKYIKGLEDGDIFNTVTNKIYGKMGGSIRAIPLFYTKSQMLFRPMDQGGGILCISVDGKTGGERHPESCLTCPDNQWKDGKHPACSKVGSFVCMLPDYAMDLIVVSFKSTGIKDAKQWNSLIRMKQRDMFSSIYKLTAITKNKNNNDFAAFRIENDSWVTEEFFKLAEQAFNDLRNKGLKFDTDGLDNEEDTSFGDEV